MFDAIGKTRVHFYSAEMKVGFAGVVHRPAADFVTQIQQSGFVGNFLARFGGNQPARRCWWNRSLLVTGSLTQKAAGTDRYNLRAIMFGCASLLRGMCPCSRCWRRHGAAGDMLLLGFFLRYRFGDGLFGFGGRLGSFGFRLGLYR